LIDAYEYRVLRPGFDPFAPLPTDLARVDRLLVEVQRNREDNPQDSPRPPGSAPTATTRPHAPQPLRWRTRPELRRAVVRLERSRATEPDTDDDSS
jgi:hypothetical protein